MTIAEASNAPVRASSMAHEMLTLLLSLHTPQGEPRQIGLALAKPEWLGLISHFTRMPATERTRVGHSIQAAAAESPFPADGAPLSGPQQQQCDAFVGDCVLLAALAEATTPRVLLGTAVAAYKIREGNAIRAQMH